MADLRRTETGVDAGQRQMPRRRFEIVESLGAVERVEVAPPAVERLALKPSRLGQT
jgi:hypothetical protein